MLAMGDEVYGIGTIEKIYADSWPEMTIVCLGKGALHEWLQSRGANALLVEGMTKMHERNSFRTIASMPAVLHRAKHDAEQIHERLAGRGIRVVHVHWRPQQYIAGYMRRLGYASVWQINNTTSRTRLGGVGLKLNHRMARWGADLLLPASDYIASNWEGSGVPMRTVRNAAKPMFAAPSALPLDGPVRCLVAGRLVADKGHHVALQAVIAARHAGCDVSLDIYGGPLDDNPYADQLRQQIANNAMEPFVAFRGFCDDIRQKHLQYHLGLQCRISAEPCSLWVCETLVDGLPLLASATGGTLELVDDGITGYLYPAESVEQLTNCLIELCRDRPRLAAMRRATFDRGRRMFTVTRFLDETLAAYAFVGASCSQGTISGRRNPSGPIH